MLRSGAFLRDQLGELCAAISQNNPTCFKLTWGFSFEGCPGHCDGENRAKNVAQLVQLTTNLPPCSRGGGVGQRGSVGGVHGAEGSLSWFGNVRVGAYRTRRCRRDGVCPTWPKLHSLSQPSRLREWLRAETRKVQPSRRISARKPRYPTGKARAAGTYKSEQLSDLVIYSKAIISPAAARRNGIFIVGYLGFRAEISSNRCTNCSRKTSLEGSRLDSQRIKGSSWMPSSCFA